jgi:ElaB/YqjD/DUF883 family membrane-anchored ribosome-binding protein
MGIQTVNLQCDSFVSLGADMTRDPARQHDHGAAAVEHQIEQRPFISVLVAFGVGVVIGKLINL